MEAALRCCCPTPPTAGQRGTFALEITTGDRAIAPGGGFLILPPITTAQHVWSMVRWELGGCALELPDGLDADAHLVALEHAHYAESSATAVRIVNGDRPMPPGTRLRLLLRDTRVQTYAMQGAWWAIETDADGRGADAYTIPLADTPGAGRGPERLVDDYEAAGALARVDVLPAPAERLVAVLEAKPRADGAAYLAVRAEDAFGNTAPLPDTELLLTSSDPAFVVPERLACAGDGPFAVRIDGCRATEPGTYFVRVSAPGSGLATESSFTSTELSQPVFFGDLHGHSALSDGLGSGADYFRHARDVSFCDFVCLTDHNIFNRAVIDLTEQHDEPGRFVTLFGRERGDEHGHRNIYSTEARVVADCGKGDLWDCLKQHGDDVLIVPHHTNASTERHWKHASFERYDPERERLIEVCQNRGTFECDEIGGPCFDGGHGASVRDALRMGRRFGFIGGSDTHRGHPGGPSHPLHPYFEQWKPFTGLTAARMPTLTRDGLWHALWDRRTYATTGARILLDVTINGAAMGSELPWADGLEVVAFVAAAAPIAGVDVVRDGEVCHTIDGDGRIARLRWEDPTPGQCYYVRVRQVDGHHAYASPIWIGF